MAVGLITKKYLEDIAEAIRVKLGNQNTYTPPQMASAISDITGLISGTITKSSNTDVGLITDAYLSDIADAIREKLDVETGYTPDLMADAILSISGGLLPDYDIMQLSDFVLTQSQSLSSPVQMAKGQSQINKGEWCWSSDSSAPCGYKLTRVHSGYNTTMMLPVFVPASYNKLYIDATITNGNRGSWNLFTLYIRDAYGITGYYGGNFAGNNLKTVSFTNYNSTAAAINSQPGVTINVPDQYSLPRQTIIVDVSDIAVDMYLGWHCMSNVPHLYSVVAKSA